MCYVTLLMISECQSVSKKRSNLCPKVGRMCVCLFVAEPITRID